MSDTDARTGPLDSCEHMFIIAGVMPRPLCCRRVSGAPVFALFKPVGSALHGLEQVAMTLDELEAIKLADLEGLYQEQAAARMGVSRPTFGRIVTTAHRKVAEALVWGKALRIEGGVVASVPAPRPRCHACQLQWDEAGECMEPCPRCQCPVRAERTERAQAGSIETSEASRNVSEKARAKETT
jgi:uncharacterized protein